jgi:hypothetical protein
MEGNSKISEYETFGVQPSSAKAFLWEAVPHSIGGEVEISTNLLVVRISLTVVWTVLRSRRRGRGSERDGLLSANRRVCPGFAPSYGAYEERNPKIVRRIFF